MLAYNIWRHMKMIADKSEPENLSATGSTLKGIMTNTVRIARLKLLFIAEKVSRHSGRDKIKYSIHDSRTPEVLHFFIYLDSARSARRPWHGKFICFQNFAI
jgi:hypothetical protein